MRDMRGVVRNRPDWLPVPRYPADAFAGTAGFYAAGRPPYPKALLDDLLRRARITGNGRLIDLGCGPGRIALALASSFREVLAVDRDREMIAVGREIARERGIGNVRWKVGRAEDVKAPEGSFELVTCGESFHRLDQWVVARKALKWLRPGGVLATMGPDGAMRRRRKLHIYAEKVFRRLARDLSAKVKSGKRDAVAPVLMSIPNHRRVLRAAGFVGVRDHYFRVRHVWTVDSLVACYLSVSGASRRVLGDRVPRVAAGLRRALLRYDPRGRYRETMGFGYTLARRPGA